MRERERRRRSNEVRHEVDGWPWREREYDSPSVCFSSFFVLIFVSDDDIAGVNSTTLDLLWLFFKHPQRNSGTYPIPNTCEDSEQDGPYPASHFFFSHGVTKAERNCAHTPSCTRHPLTEQILSVPRKGRRRETLNTTTNPALLSRIPPFSLPQ